MVLLFGRNRLPICIWSASKLPMLSVFVHSTDSYSDCWQPLFELIRIYWPDRTAPLFLNNEFLDYKHPGLEIYNTFVGNASRFDRFHSWSCRFIAGLKQVKSPYVLYLQEDYFLSNRVRQEKIDEILEIMEREGLTNVNLQFSTPRKSWRHHPSHPDFIEMPQRGGYRLSTSAGIWRVEKLLSYLKPGETVWQWERDGSRRAHNIKDSIYFMNPDLYNGQERGIYPYHSTGIVRGKWYKPAVIDLFEKNNIHVDYSKRGFYEPSFLEQIKLKIRSKIRQFSMRIPNPLQ